MTTLQIELQDELVKQFGLERIKKFVEKALTRRHFPVLEDQAKTMFPAQNDALTLDQIKNKLVQLKQELYDRFGVDEIGVFGSFVRNEQTPDSDIDVLISYDPNRSFSLLTLVELEDFLATTFQRKVDVAFKNSLKPVIGKQILSEVQYL